MTLDYLLNFIVPLIIWSYPGFVAYIMVTMHVDHFSYMRTRPKMTDEEKKTYDRNRFILGIVFYVLCGPMAWIYMFSEHVGIPVIIEIIAIIKVKLNLTKETKNESNGKEVSAGPHQGLPQRGGSSS